MIAAVCAFERLIISKNLTVGLLTRLGAREVRTMIGYGIVKIKDVIKQKDRE